MFRGSAQGHGQARPHGHIYELRWTQKFRLKLAPAVLALSTGTCERLHAHGPRGHGSGHPPRCLEVTPGSWWEKRRRTLVGREGHGFMGHGRSEVSRPEGPSSGLFRMAAVAEQSRFSSPSGTQLPGKLVSSSMNGMMNRRRAEAAENWPTFSFI
jgi:hypothetical protein